MKYVGALRCSRAVIPFMKTAGWGRIINISGGNARNAGNLSGGARNAGLVHMTKTLAVQLGRHGITRRPRVELASRPRKPKFNVGVAEIEAA